MSHYNSKKRKVLKSTNTDHYQCSRCRHCYRLHLQMGGGVEKAEAVEVGVEVVEAVHRMKNRHSTSARSSRTWSSSSIPWTVSATSTAPYPFCGIHTTQCTSCRLPWATSAPTHSMHGPDRGWPPHRSQLAQLQTQSLKNMTC